MGGQGPASVLQLSTFTTVQSIPRPEQYSGFPVTVRLVAPDITVRGPVDIVVAIDVSQSEVNEKLQVEKDAAATVLAELRPGDRLALLPFDTDVTSQADKEPVAMSDEGKERALKKLQALHETPGGGTRLSKPLERAEKILIDRRDVNRPAFIILLSDGGDRQILKDKEWTRILKDTTYPVHTFGFKQGRDAETLGYIAERTSGTYTAVDDPVQFTAAYSGLLSKAGAVRFSAAGTRVDLTAVHPGVLLSRIDAGQLKAAIAVDRRSGTVDVGVANAGHNWEFTVYLDVPAGDAAMDLLVVGGVYTQGWDGRQVELARSVVYLQAVVYSVVKIREGGAQSSTEH